MSGPPPGPPGPSDSPSAVPSSPTLPLDVPAPYANGDGSFENVPIQFECWETAPETDEEWAQALKSYAWDRPSELASSCTPEPRPTRDRGTPLIPREEYAHDHLSQADVLSRDHLQPPALSEANKAGVSPSASPQFNWSPVVDDAGPESPALEELADLHWPPPRQPDSMMVSGALERMDARASGLTSPAPLASHSKPAVSACGLVDKDHLPRQVNSLVEENNHHSAEEERRRLREFYDQNGYLPTPRPSPSTLQARAAALRRLGMNGEDSGARYAVISKYCDLLCMMFDNVRSGITVFRGGIETVYLSHSKRRAFHFPNHNALSGHSILSSDWRCWVCTDMDKDWRFRNNPDRNKGASPRFFAAAPLRYHRPEDGDTVDFGALVIVSTEPREFGPREQAMLLRVSNMLVFQLATLQSEIMAKRSSAMYESSISFLRRSFIPERLQSAQAAPVEDKQKKRTSKARRSQSSHPRRGSTSTGGTNNMRLSLNPLTPPPPQPQPQPQPITTKTGPRDAKRAKRRDVEAEEHLFNDAAKTLRGILQADAVAMVDLHEFQLFVRKTASPLNHSVRAKESIIADFLQGKTWPANVEPVVNFVPRYSNQGVSTLGQSCGQGMEFDFSSPTVPQVLRELIKTYITTRHFWWDRQDRTDKLAQQVMMFMPDKGQTVLATVFMTYTGALRYATFAVWSRAPCTFDDSSRLALPFVWIIGAALMSSLAILRVRAIEESQITYSNLQAHELRTPLHQILAITQLLRSSISDFADAPVVTGDSGLTTLQQVRDLLPLLDAIDTSGTTLHGIVENILTFLDLSAKDDRWGRVPGNPTVVNRTGVPQTLAAMLEELIHDAYDDDKRGRIGSGQPLGHIETIFEIIPCDLGEMVTEDYGGALRRALARVIHNAYRYIEVAGCVEIYVDDVKSMLPPEGCEDLASTRRVLITIKDDGRGMGPDFVREKLGEPWAKEDLYATGSGLSVHLAYRIIDLMHGDMEITSAPGQGCAVTIEVPLPVSQTPGQLSPIASERKVALIGFNNNNPDDDCTHLDRLGKSLDNQYRKLGCEIVDVNEADLVVVDSGLEETPTGLNTIAALNAPEVVILAASNEDEHRIVESMSGPNRRVRRMLKPVTPTLIRQTLHQAVPSVPATPTDGPEGPRPRPRPHFDQAALARSSGAPVHGPSWKPRGVCVEDAVASLSLGDYFSSRARGASHPSSSGSNASNSLSDGHETGPYTETSTVESESPMWSRVAPSSSTATTPSTSDRQHHLPDGTDSELTPNLTTPARVKVLVVEDNIINRKILVKILKASLPHLDIYEAEDGVDAVERFREFITPAIILLDINMPRMDGYAAAVEMRIIEKQRAAEAAGLSPLDATAGCITPVRRSKIIAVTALSGEDERHRGLVECDMDQWLTKPCPKSTLQKVVDDARLELSAWDL